ncbi:MAG: flagellar transcriptional regulator FlhC [Nitrosospira sp.]|nr:flagellar transcriptional regulator FlhC [Nitrosospira sp.]
MRKKSLVSEARDIQIAIEMINLGARLQLLESETNLSRERLIKLYKELKGVSPPKGMLPFSADWFLTWQPNIHSSVFADIYRYLINHADCRGIEATVKSYKLYLEHCHISQMEPILSLTRAWTLLRFFEGNMLQTAPCTQCGGRFVVHTHDLYNRYVCGLCHTPSRAGKTNKVRAIALAAVAA